MPDHDGGALGFGLGLNLRHLGTTGDQDPSHLCLWGTESGNPATIRGLKGPRPRLFCTLAAVVRDEMEAKEMGLAGMAFSMISIAAGAVMYWAVTSQGHGFRLSTVGVILMVVGAVGLVISTVIFAMSRRPAGSRDRTYDKQVTDTAGRTAEVHEEVHH